MLHTEKRHRSVVDDLGVITFSLPKQMTVMLFIFDSRIMLNHCLVVYPRVQSNQVGGSLFLYSYVAFHPVYLGC